MPDAFSLPAYARADGAARADTGAAGGPVGTPAPVPGRGADGRAADGRTATADGAGTMGGGAAAEDGGGQARPGPPGLETGSAVSLLPSVTLPKGGGAIRGLEEKLTVTAATGTASLGISLPLSPGRSGFTPPLRLAYDSGSGNGPLGFGWSLGVPAITRKTDKGLPRYCDGEESDVFILAGAEDLVPVLDQTGARQSLTRTVDGATYQVTFYRPRIEGLFSRIERWTSTQTGVSHWRTLSRDNVTALYGADPGSTVADPADPARIFSWNICRTWDDQGNAALYSYAAEDSAGVSQAAAHEANRTAQTRAAQIYLTTVQYGNVQPYFPNGNAKQAAPFPQDWIFRLVLDYGDHTAAPPTPQPDQPWPVRPDPFSTYRPGFEVRTYRRVQRLLMFNNFPGEPTAGADCLVRSLDLAYSDQQAPPDPGSPLYTFVVSMTQTGYRQGGQGPVTRSMPPVEFSYSTPQIDDTVLTLDPDSQANLPEGLDGTRYRWTDLDGEGLPGILADAGGGWYYKRNLSAGHLVEQPDGTLATRASFGPLETVAALPSRSDLSGVRLLDLTGSGRLDVVDLSGPDAGYFERTEDGTFGPLQRFAALPELDWSDPNVKFIDVTGDGLADVLMTEDGLYTVHASLCGDAGFDTARLVRPGWDEERGPAVVLADGTQTIFTADMSGDGLVDIVRVRNGEACYWPNTGYGSFGAKVTMDQAPRFDSEERFDPGRIRLADIDGSGTADLLYVGEEGVTAWFNQSGNAWSQPTAITAFPGRDNLSSVQASDLLGTGTSCLVWSSPLPGETAAPMRYVDLMGGRKPHLLTCVRNNLGAETRVTYAPSTRFYVADETAGTPWVTRLPFPVQVVERVETFDWIGRNRLVSRYAYHHGYFDGYEREFRGFGLVEQWDTEEFRTDTAFDDGDAVNWDQQSWSPPVLTRTWLHTGAFTEAPEVSQQYLTEYWTEPALRGPGQAANAAAMRPPDTVLPGGLDGYEAQEAYRALKGRTLRTEIYAQDGSAAAANPYTVTERNFSVDCLQHMGPNLHAVFLVSERETLTFEYEREPADPRVGHVIVLETDDYGNVVRSVSAGYPRRVGYAPPEPALSPAFQGMLAYDQGRPHVMGTERGYTNAIDDPLASPDAHRVPLLSSVDTAEITGVAPLPKGNGITDLFGFDEIDSAWAAVWPGSEDVPYEQIPGSDVDGSGSPAAAPTRRLTARQRICYRSDDLTALLPFGTLQSRALPGESYRAALTPGLLDAIFGPLVPPATLTEGGYVQITGEQGWWMPSGRVYYSPGDSDTPAQELSNALAQFFRPRRAVDPFGGITRAGYDGYSLLTAGVTDPVGNLTTAGNDYRVLAPATVTDPNGNRAAAAFEVLGLVTATAVMGTTSETVGDLLTGFVADLDEATLQAQFTDPLAGPAAILGNATTRCLYDVGAYQRTSTSPQPSPPAAYTLARETHVSDLAAPPPYPGAPQTTAYQYHFAYSDGLGREIQRKARVSPGPVPGGGAQVSPRWAGTGWTILDNKGRPVRTYEPFFSVTNGFEFAAQAGVATVTCYDPPGRVVATLRPDNSWTKAVFSPWRQEAWDGDDTVLIPDPRADADVGPYFQRVLGTAAFTSWYELRIGGSYGTTAEDRAAQQAAAQAAAGAAATPAATHRDALGRTCLSVADNGTDGRYPMRTARDTEGQPLAVFDPLGRRAEEHCYRSPQASGGFRYLAGTDMAGHALYHVSADGGARRGLANVSGLVIRNWDARGHAFRLLYDAALRPTHRYVSTGGAPEILAGLSVYGEGQPAGNLHGRLFRGYDMAGYLENSQYDYKGNLLAGVRQLAAGYHAAVDWTPLSGLTTAAQLDAAAAGLLATGDSFAGSTVFDALNRPIQVVTPHSTAMSPDVIRTGYDEASLLNQVDVWLQQAAAPAALLDPASAGLHAVTGVTYNARGQRLAISGGNGTGSQYAYDPQTFRLLNLTTTRPGSFAAGQQTAQDLSYYYDPAGNVTRISDDADTQDVIFFRNQRVEPSAAYGYDAIYRLVSATGREHLGQTGGGLSAPQQVTNDDSFRTGLPQPGDGNAMGTYTETYGYDAAGNILTVAHQVGSGSWTRRYGYAEPSQIVAAETGNRLSSTSLPGDPAGGPFSGKYAHDQDGNMTAMPHLASLTWDEDDRLRSTVRAPGGAPGAAGAGPQMSYHVYNGGGQRVRKATDWQAVAGQTAGLKTERIYLGAIEIYREYAADGTTVTLQRETLHVTDGGTAIVLAETRTAGTDRAPAQLVRYQYGNLLGSSVLELDDQSGIISYEEYFPYGSTSYQAVASQTDLPKRYRYAGKERDEENDLYYHGARYCAPWLGRWISCDPAGLADGPSPYGYARSNPVTATDPDGRQSQPATAGDAQPPAGAARKTAPAPPKPAGPAGADPQKPAAQPDSPAQQAPAGQQGAAGGSDDADPAQVPNPMGSAYPSGATQTAGDYNAAISGQGSGQTGQAYQASATYGLPDLSKRTTQELQGQGSYTVDPSGNDAGTVQFGYHLNTVLGTARRTNLSFFANPLALTLTAPPPGFHGVNWSPQGSLTLEHLWFGEDEKHSKVNTGVNVGAGTQAFAPISSLSTSPGPSTSPSAIGTTTFVRWPVNLSAVANVTGNLLYSGSTPRLTPWIEGYAGAADPGGASSAWTAGGTAGVTANLPLGPKAPILSIGLFAGFKEQWARVQGSWTSQPSFSAGGGVGLSWR
jgi:RHS repeat-associated protein